MATSRAAAGYPAYNIACMCERRGVGKALALLLGRFCYGAANLSAVVHTRKVVTTTKTIVGIHYTCHALQVHLILTQLVPGGFLSPLTSEKG